VNIQDAIDVIESVAGFTDESTPVGEAWLEVLSFIHHPTALSQLEPARQPTFSELLMPPPRTALAQSEPVAPTDEALLRMAADIAAELEAL
jgi:hypothetical protein